MCFILQSTGNEWKNVKHVFAVTPGANYMLSIFPPQTNVHGFAIVDIRACSLRGMNLCL